MNKEIDPLTQMSALMLPYLGTQGCWLFGAFAIASGKSRSEFLAECAGIYDEIVAIAGLTSALQDISGPPSTPPLSDRRPRGVQPDEPEDPNEDP